MNPLHLHNPAFEDHTLGNQPATQLPSIWFENEDIQEEDNIVLESLLESSFAEWLADAADLTLLGNAIGLCGKQGALITSTGFPVKGRYDSRKCERLAAASCRKGQPQIDGDTAAVPILKRSDNLAFAALVMVVDGSLGNGVAELAASALHFRILFYNQFERRFVREMAAQLQLTAREADRRETLFEVSRRLHDRYEVSSVLNVLLVELESLYPYSNIDLYLSQDYLYGDTRVKPLYARDLAADIYTKAFLNGQPVIECEEHGRMKLAIPMGGKQAVYGVLSITMEKQMWNESDLHVFMTLSESAGSAFENAKLFEQSNLLIGELQLINDLTKRINQSLRLNEIFQFTMTELLHIFKAHYCNVLQLNKETNQFHVMSSNLPTAADENYTTEYGFCGIVFRTGEPLIISDYRASRVVDSKLMDVTGSRSLIATPLMANSEVVGVIMVSHQSPNYFSYDNFKLLQVLSIHIGLAISNASLHAEVRRMVITDNLTGLHARHYLNEQIQSKQRKDSSGSLVLVDIDHFKHVNDTYGHQIGDRILIAVSDIIRTCIRESDIAARWGGEELAVYLPQIRSDQAYTIATRIRSRVEENTDPRVTVSCGISEWTSEDEKISVESLFYRADMALYEAKNNGRNNVSIRRVGLTK
ncbi:sensor domain-containing diguanylate cyclase [Paenibacillus sp. sptzw28]|uniref:sensor domain-containing diguanylate cyclase n=1 Tax=Paenibacillus sp. sptzw28 TaxID=715179 RepID=UPI001C6EDD44|nr:sensor domain-containing diguanylate cyclase [Paenibacillus sp. sptzw28]QYR24067.1 sensor domain-containing diguanylate cyclase [Paenibacillus sp. sptzw28]